METELPEAARDAEVSHPSTTTETTRQVYNLKKGKDGNRGHDYSRRFGDHSMALMHIALEQLQMRSGLCKYKREGHKASTKEFLHLHTREIFGPLNAKDMTAYMGITCSTLLQNIGNLTLPLFRGNYPIVIQYNIY